VLAASLKFTITMLHPSVYENPELLWVWLLLGFGAGALCHLSLSLSRWARTWTAIPEAGIYGTCEMSSDGTLSKADASIPATPGDVRRRSVPERLGLILVLAITLLASHHHLSLESPRNDLRKYQRHAGILVEGDMRFQKAVCDALALLETAAPDKFKFVRDRIGLIVQGVPSEPTRAIVSVAPPFVAMSPKPMTSSNHCAAALVHEAMHIELMRQAEKRNNGAFHALDVGGTLAELRANEIACDTLRQIGDPENIALALQAEGGAHGNVCEEFALQYPDAYMARPLQSVYPELWGRLDQFRRTLPDRNPPWLVFPDPFGLPIVSISTTNDYNLLAP
jgi:hypothetical protein